MNTRVVWLYFDLTMNNGVLEISFGTKSILKLYKEIIIVYIIG